MIEFNEEKHEYILDGKKLISVTQLMRKHGLAPSYDGVLPEVLKAKAERGTLIHKEIELYNKDKEIGFTNELMNYIEWINQNQVEILESEFMTHNDIVAGTIDLVYTMRDKFYISDIKTTSSLHIEAVSWQLSIYSYLFWNGHDKSEELAKLDYNTTNGQAYHFDKDGNLKVVDIMLKPYEEVEKLMIAEREGKIFNEVIIIEENNLSNFLTLEEVINQLNKQVEEAKKKQDEFKKALMKEMEERGLKTFEKNGVKITICQPVTNEKVVDKEALNPEIVKEYEEIKERYNEEVAKHTTINPIKKTPYLRITIKEKKDE